MNPCALCSVAMGPLVDSLLCPPCIGVGVRSGDRRAKQNTTKRLSRLSTRAPQGGV